MLNETIEFNATYIRSYTSAYGYGNLYGICLLKPDRKIPQYDRKKYDFRDSIAQMKIPDFVLQEKLPDFYQLVRQGKTTFAIKGTWYRDEKLRTLFKIIEIEIK